QTGAWCELVVNDRDDTAAGAGAMLDPRNDLLADIAALFEVDGSELVHVCFVRESITVAEVEPAARHTERDAMGFIIVSIGEIGAEIRGRLCREVRGQHDARAESRQPRMRRSAR